MTHICVGKLTIIGSDNGLSPGRQAIIQTNDGILLIGPLRNKFQWNLKQNWCIFIQENAFETVVCEMASILSQPQCVKYGQDHVFSKWWGKAISDYTRGQWLIDAPKHHEEAAAKLVNNCRLRPLLLILIFARINDHAPNKAWDEIIHPFPNFNGCTVEVWEWIHPTLNNGYNYLYILK